MSPYLMALIISVNTTKQVAHLLEMPPHMWILGGCLWQYFSFLGAFFLQKDVLQYHYSHTVHSSVKTTSWNCSSTSSRRRFTQSTVHHFIFTSVLIIFCHCIIDKAIMVQWNCLCLSLSQAIKYRSSFLPPGNCILYCLEGSEYIFLGQGSLDL